MLTGENIISFSKDWGEDRTSNDHVLIQLSKHNRVLWINSLSTRTPTFSKGSDMRRIFRKLKKFTEGPFQVNENMWVYTPIVLPFPHSRVAQSVNEHILKATIKLLRKKFHMPTFQLWTFLPTSSPYVGKLGESLVVYYCVDEWSQFKHMDTDDTVRLEEDLCRNADVVFATANSLVENKKQLNPSTYLASHGVDYAHFAKALHEDTPVAEEIAGLPKPVIGFFGLLHSWLDQELIAFVARQRPEWSIVVIGKAVVDDTLLREIPNVYLLGRKHYDSLPSYCKGFSAATIPFAVNELTHHVNPIKLREYLSAGLPVVSTALPEVLHYSDFCKVADTYDDFLSGLEEAVKNDSPEARQRRSDAMKQETWEAKVEAIGEIVRNVKEGRTG